MNCVSATFAGDADDLIDAKVGGNGAEAFADAVGFVRFETVQAQLVFFGEHGDSFFAHFVGGAHDADCDFTPIGDEDFVEFGHGSSPFGQLQQFS
jgi:hypothetical protein